MSEHHDKSANTAAELFDLLNESWKNIARHLTASYAPRRKRLLRDDFKSKLPIIEKRIQIDAAAGNGESANHWRRADFFIRSIIAELEMWLAIHSNDIFGAWNAFCSAESLAARVSGWLPDYALAQERVSHLAEVERVVFPHQPWFLSSGLIVSKETCTICDSDYGTCGHLAGEIYNGTVAWRRCEQIKEALEVSFVSDPSDKSCRIYGVSGGIDPLTGEPSPRLKQAQPTVKPKRRHTKKTRRKKRKK